MIEFLLFGIVLALFFAVFVVGYWLGMKHGAHETHRKYYSSLINQKEKSREHAHRSLVRKTKSAIWI